MEKVKISTAKKDTTTIDIANGKQGNHVEDIITVSEKLKATEALNHQLIDINNAVTPFRTRAQVMKIIKEQLSKFVPVDSFYIIQNTHYNATNGSYSKFMMFTQGMHPEIVSHPDFIKYHAKNTLEALDLKDAHKLTSEEYDAYQSNFFNYKDVHPTLIEQYPIAKIEMALGFKSAIVIPLFIEHKKIASLVINSFALDAYSATDLSLLEKLCEPIAIGVSNVLLYEEMQTAKAEIEALNQQLMDINNAITPFRTREQVMKIIGEQLKRVIAFDEFYIVHFSEDYRFQKFFLDGLLPEIKESLPDAVTNGTYYPIGTIKGSVEKAIENTLNLITTRYELEKPSEKVDWDTIPIYVAAWKAGVKEALAIPLRVESKLVAILMLHSKTKNQFQLFNKQLLEKIAEPIAIGVSNVLLYEEMQAAKAEIEEKEKEKSLQIAVVNALTETGSWEEKFKTVAGILEKTFDWHLIAFLYNAPSEAKYFTFIKNKNGKIEFHSAEKLRKLFGITDAEAEEYVTQDEPHYAEAAIYNEEKYLKSLQQSQWKKLSHDNFGHRSSMHIPLPVGEKGMMKIIAASKLPNAYTQAHLDSLLKLASPVSLAIEKLQAFDNIEQREKEKSLQVEVINAITSTKEKQQALYNLAKVIDGVIPFYTFSVAFPFDVDELIGYKKMNDGQLEKWNNVEDMIAAAKIDVSAYKQMVTAMAGSGHYSKAHICTGKEYEQLCNDYTLARLHHRYEGINSVMHLPFFMTGQTASAHIYLTNREKNGFTQKQLELFQRMITPLSLALENLFSFEDIEQREKEKTLQVAVTNALTSTRDWSASFYQLAKVLHGSIPFFTFSIAFTAPNKILSSFNFKSGKSNNVEPWDVFKEAAHRFDLSRDEYYNLVVEMTTFEQEGIFVGDDYKKLCNQYQLAKLHHVFFDVKSALKILVRCTSTVCPVHVYLTSKDAAGFSQETFIQMKRLLPSLSLAFENLFAFEDIEQREKEKTMLLGISECIAAVRNREELFAVINKIILPIFGNDQLINLSIVEPDGIHYRILVSSGLDSLKINQKVQDEISRPQVLKGSRLMEDLMEVQKPVIYTFEEVRQQYPDNASVGRMKLIGVRQFMATAMRTGGKALGVLSVHSTEHYKYSAKDIPLFQSITDQLAVAVSNIFANEAIIEKEKEKSLQLQAIDALTIHETWEEKCFALAKTIQFFLPFDYAVLGFENGEYMQRCYGFQQMGADEYRTIEMLDFQQMAGITNATYQELRKRFSISAPLLLNGKDFENASQQFELLRLRSRLFKVKSCVALPVACNPGIKFILRFYSTQAELFSQQDVNMLQKMAPVLAVTLEKIIALEQVEGKQKEIEKQLAEIKKLQQQVEAENAYLQESIDTVYNYGDIIGTSQAMQHVYQAVSQVAGTDSTVLILGETGTGKELIARAIHNASSRKDKLLVKINCAALPPNLVESELFGHERGSFTGAIERRIGKFELANKGTLFLDEIGEMPIELQAKLLRALQEKEIERIGGKTVIKTDVRIIAATNRKLEEEVKAQKFRSDLFFRINIFPIKLPPLHKRKEDIPLLANHFLQKFCNAMGRTITGIETSTLKALMAYQWPGNIRELENVIERAVIINKSKILRINIGLYSQQNNDMDALSINKTSMENYNEFRVKTYKDAERELILKTIEIAKGRIRGAGGAAALLQVNPTTLESRMKKLGLIKKNKIDVVD